MPTQIFINLPVKDLDRSKAFFEALGFGFNAQFTNETAACLVISDTIYAMLLTEPMFASFTPKAICDTSTSTEVLIALSRESRAEVDDMVGKAIAAGGRTYSEAKDYGFMYQHAFEDPDGHQWELMWMDPAAVDAPEG